MITSLVAVATISCILCNNMLYKIHKGYIWTEPYLGNESCYPVLFFHYTLYISTSLRWLTPQIIDNSTFYATVCWDCQQRSLKLVIKALHRVIIGSNWAVWSWHIHEYAFHYDDVIMGAIASQITSLTIVYSTVYSGLDQRKHQSSASLAFVWGIHRGPVNSPHKWPVTRKMFPFDDVIMSHICWSKCALHSFERKCRHELPDPVLSRHMLSLGHNELNYDA